MAENTRQFPSASVAEVPNSPRRESRRGALLGRGGNLQGDNDKRNRDGASGLQLERASDPWRQDYAADTGAACSVIFEVGSILKECVSVALAFRMAETEQYLVVDSSMARSTSAASMPSP